MYFVEKRWTRKLTSVTTTSITAVKRSTISPPWRAGPIVMGNQLKFQLASRSEGDSNACTATPHDNARLTPNAPVASQSP